MIAENMDVNNSMEKFKMLNKFPLKLILHYMVNFCRLNDRKPSDSKRMYKFMLKKNHSNSWKAWREAMRVHKLGKTVENKIKDLKKQLKDHWNPLEDQPEVRIEGKYLKREIGARNGWKCLNIQAKIRCQTSPIAGAGHSKAPSPVLLVFFGLDRFN